jgi:hypothetical protein
MKQDALLNTKIVTPMVTQNLEKGSITIEKVIVSKSIVKINAIETNLPRESFYQYQVVDIYGNVLKPISGSGYGSNGIQKTEFAFESLNNNPRYFIITALNSRGQTNNKLIDVKVEVKEELPIKISQGEGGEISVTKIEYLSNKTLVYYTYKGDDPYGNGTCLWLEDEFGNKLYSNLSDYMYSGKRQITSFNEELVKYHRPMSEIINVLIQEGFNIKGVLEPVPDEEALEKRPDFIDEFHRTTCIIIKAQLSNNI